MLKGKNLERVIVPNLMNKKGQALVEFVIIIPVIIMIIFVIIDFSNIFYQRNHLESIVNDVVSYKESGKTNDYIEEQVEDDIDITYKENYDTLTINVSKDINLITPFSSLFFEEPYTISTERTIIYEQ